MRSVVNKLSQIAAKHMKAHGRDKNKPPLTKRARIIRARAHTHTHEIVMLD